MLSSNVSQHCIYWTGCTQVVKDASNDVCIMYIYVIIKYIDQRTLWYSFTPGIPYSMPILTSPLIIECNIVTVAVLLKLCYEYDAWRLNWPELITIHCHLRAEHTTQSPAYSRTTTEWPGCSLGHANILLPPVFIYFNPILTGIVICMSTWDITCKNEISFLLLAILYIFRCSNVSLKMTLQGRSM